MRYLGALCDLHTTGSTSLLHSKDRDAPIGMGHGAKCVESIDNWPVPIQGSMNSTFKMSTNNAMIETRRQG